MTHIHIIHENDEWTAPLIEALRARDLPYRDWHLAHGSLDLDRSPPAGVFYSRMSASSHTRGHRYAPELTGAVLAWLEGYGARVLNGTQALRLELSKAAQYAALRRHGIRTPRTAAAVGRGRVVEAARTLRPPFIIKHNRAGKGLGVKLFQGMDELERHVASDEFEPSVDGITLVQDFIRAPEPFVTRVEFVGQAFLYAVRVDTSRGFELCPADACGPGDEFCPADDGGHRFEILAGFRHPLLEAYREFMIRHDIDVAAFEFIVDASGRDYTYDINTNTNYNAEAETRAGVSGMGALAERLGEELGQVRGDGRRLRRLAAV